MKKRNFTGSLERPPQPSPRAKTALQRLKDCRMAGPGVDRAVASKRCSQLAKAEGKGGLALRFHEDGLSRGSEKHARVREEMPAQARKWSRVARGTSGLSAHMMAEGASP